VVLLTRIKNMIMIILKEKNRDKKKDAGIKEERSPSCASTTTFCQIYHFSLLL